MSTMRARIARLTRSPQTDHRRRRHGSVRAQTAAPPEVPAPAPATPRPEHRAPEDRVRQAGGPEDRASYTCGCGYVFEADVSTSVACPHCGASQAW